MNSNRKIISHKNNKYLKAWNKLSDKDKTNGAYFYSKEICNNMIPYIKTDRNWVTVRVKSFTPPEHSIVFIHNNLHLEWYDNLNPNEHDYILVCGLPQTVEKLKEKFGDTNKIIYLPLSIDVNYVKRFAQPKTKEVAFAGRQATRTRGNYEFAPNTDFVESLSHEDFLSTLAQYKKVYAIGRCALEAKALGCEILPFHPWFPDPEVWQVLDNVEAAKMLQKMIDEIDK